VEFAPAGTAAFGNRPAAGVENVISIRVNGRPARIEASVIDSAAKSIARLPLEPGDAEGVYQPRWTPGSEAFRFMIAGQTPEGTPFQRVHAPLLTAR
jgi:hypothetical protein